MQAAGSQSLEAFQSCSSLISVIFAKAYESLVNCCQRRHKNAFCAWYSVANAHIHTHPHPHPHAHAHTEMHNLILPGYVLGLTLSMWVRFAISGPLPQRLVFLALACIQKPQVSNGPIWQANKRGAKPQEKTW